MGQAERNRQKAKQLGAAEAEKLVAEVPYLARLLSKEQIADFQKVLDAAVLNPMYQEQFKQALKNSERARAGKLVMYNEEKKERAHRILHRRVKVSENDSYIRVDHNKMLTADALQPRTNNPDEAKYLAKVRHELISKGIWLRLKQPWGSGRDPRKWAFTFTLGRNGETIKTSDARIDREELIRTVGGYYNAVTRGPVIAEFEKQISRLALAHENGASLHQHHANIRGSTNRLIRGAADLMGGANFPPTSIWDLPFELRLKAMGALTERNFWKVKLCLAGSAVAVESNGRILAEYTKDTIRGAERALLATKVIATAASVTEFVLTMGAAGVIKFGGKKVLTEAARRRGVNQLADDYLEWEMKRGLKNVTKAELKQVRTSATFQQSATKLGSGMKARQSTGVGKGFHQGY